MNCVPLSFSSISNFETMDMNVVRTTNNKLYEHDTHRIDGKRKQEKVFFFFRCDDIQWKYFWLRRLQEIGLWRLCFCYFCATITTIVIVFIAEK